MQTLALASEKPKALKEGAQSCQQQIFDTPEGRFFHILHEGWMTDFYKSPAMTEPLAELFEKA